MLIKFQKPDPRAGMTVQMDSRRGQNFIDSGAAVPAKGESVDPVVAKIAVETGDEPVVRKPVAKKAKQ